MSSPAPPVNTAAPDALTVVLAMSNDPFALLDDDGRLVRCNEPFARLAPHWCGRPVAEKTLLWPDAPPAWWTAARGDGTLHDETGFRIEARPLAAGTAAANGATVCLRLTPHPDGGLSAQRILDHMPDAVFWKDTQSVYQGYNRAFLTEMGLPTDVQMVQKTDADLPIPVQKAASYLASDQRVMDSRTAERDLLEPKVDANGRRRWLLTDKIPLCDEAGRVVGVLGSIKDVTAQKRSADTLRQQVRFLRTLLNTIPGPVFYVDQARRFLGCNDRFADEVARRPRRQLVGVRLSDPDVLPAGMALPFENGAQRTFAGETQVSFEVNFEVSFETDAGADTAAGPPDARRQRREYVVYQAPLLDADLRTYGLIGVMLDVTERNQTQRNLEESHNLFLAMYEESDDAIFLVDAETELISDCNQRAVDMFGARSRSQLIGRTGTEWHADQARQQMTDARHDAHSQLDQQGIWRTRVHYRGLDGRAFWGNLSVMRLRSFASGYQHVRVTDVTEMVHHEEHLRRQETNLRSILDHNDSFIWMVDARLRLIDYNVAAEQLYHLFAGADLTRGADALEILAEEQRHTWRERYQSALQGQPGVYCREVTLGAEQRVLEVKMFPIWAGLETTGVVVFADDITQAVRTREQLGRQFEALQKINLELDNFVYRVSHDLRAPLTSVMGLIGLARAEPAADQREVYLALMLKSLHKLDGFIRDILDLSRNARLELEQEPIDFEALINETFEKFSYMEDSQRVEKRCRVSLSAPYLSDRRRLRVVLDNLISNAIRYRCSRHEPSFVMVEVERRQGQLCLTVSDNGQGIGADHLDHVCEMFYRASDGNVGSGLGLYIVRETTDKLGGTLHIASELNAGTRFTITLPEPPSPEALSTPVENSL